MRSYTIVDVMRRLHSMRQLVGISACIAFQKPTTHTIRKNEGSIMHGRDKRAGSVNSSRVYHPWTIIRNKLFSPVQYTRTQLQDDRPNNIIRRRYRPINSIQFNSIVYFRHTFGPYHIIICHNTIEKCKSNIYMTACVA